MKKKSLFWRGLLLCAMAFSMTGCTIGGDDKENEIVEDPLKNKTEYYIVGTVTNVSGSISGASVEITGSDIKTTTDANGVYSLAVSEAKTYNVKFTADNMEAYEASTTITSGAANHTQVVLNVKMGKAIDFSEGNTETAKTDEDVTLEIPHQEDKSGATATVNIPATAAAENTEVTAVAYEEAQTAEAATTTEKTAATSVNNIAIKTEPAEAIAQKDITIAIPNPTKQESEGYFDPANMEAWKDGTATTRAAEVFSKIQFIDNHYIITIPTGEKISGKYSTKVKFTKKADSDKANEYNNVNGKETILKIENRNYSAMENVKITIVSKNGWTYITDPTTALSAAGASTTLAGNIRKCIEGSEGKEGVYTVTRELTANISGNHVLYFGNKAKTCTKTYTFKVIVGGQTKNVTITLKCYTGYTEEYTNAPISEHSGGGTGTL